MDLWRKGSKPKLNVPYFPEKGDRALFENASIDDKIVVDYARIDMISVLDLDIFAYWGYLHDAVVFNCQKTEQGREYLENAYNYSQTSADRVALRKLLGGDK